MSLPWFIEGSLEVKLPAYGFMQPGLCKEPGERGSQKKEDQRREGPEERRSKRAKCQESRDTLCFFDAVLEGRQVGPPKRRAQRSLATMWPKIYTTLWQENDWEAKIVNNWHARDAFLGSNYVSCGNTWQAQEFMMVAKRQQARRI